jgi:uncharacterized SAM-binding protein YcdF (DUF218 family)
MDTLFFITAKLAWLLLRPASWLVLLLAGAALALRAGRGPLARRLLHAATAGLIGIAVLPLGDAVLAPLEARFPPAPAPDNPAGIIVLGGAENGVLSAAHGRPVVGDAAERILDGIALARRHPDIPVILSGGSGRLQGGPDGAGTAARLFAAAGIAPERLIVERRSRNTAENAARARPLAARAAGSGRWILVTSAFHMPRAVGSFCAAGWGAVTPWPTDYRAGAFAARIGWNPVRNLDALTTGLKEWVGLVAYRLTGRTRALLPAGCG